MLSSLIFLAVGSWLLLGMLFFGYPTVKRLKGQSNEFGWIVKVPVYVGFGLGYAANCTFNAIWGSIIFRELPKEWVFSSRLKRHWYGDDIEQKARAHPWVKRVNLIDPGHI